MAGRPRTKTPKAQKLDRVLSCYRISDPDGEHKIFDAAGSKLFPGRWNTMYCPVIYTSEHYSTAMLEKLAAGSGQLPPNQHFIEITIPNGVSYEILNTAHLPDWAHANRIAARKFGAAWAAEKRAALLIVPSVVARREKNFVINPAHEDFPAITHSLHEPVWWDERLF